MGERGKDSFRVVMDKEVEIFILSLSWSFYYYNNRLQIFFRKYVFPFY